MEAGKNQLRLGIESPDVVYENNYQRGYRVCVDRGAFKKEMFVAASGGRIGVIIKGPDDILLTRQYRHLIDCVSLKILGGKVDPGDGLAEAAKRECREETGMTCGEH